MTLARNVYRLSVRKLLQNGGRINVERLSSLAKSSTILTPALLSQRANYSARPLPEDEMYEWKEEGTKILTTGPLQQSSEAITAPQEINLSYVKDAAIAITSTLHIVKPYEDTPRGIWPAYRLMEQTGELRDPSYDGFTTPVLRNSQQFAASRDDPMALNDFRRFLAETNSFQEDEILSSGLLQPNKHPFPDTGSSNTLLRAHRQIVRLRQMDDILLNAQRQGRISFYMTCRGEEAIHMGAASALTPQDPIFAQYREQGLLMWRGFTLEQFTNQCFSNDLDLGKGRQMPVHYGSRALNFHTISSPLGTQLPQAVGAAYRVKLAKKPNVVICFFGDGCASTTDFHCAMNFAATLKAPVVFFCRNNGYAISTPTKDQYAGDGVVARGPGYGMASVRVDGNDIFAVHAVVREAKRYALEHQSPVLIEAMTYRQGHHSTSDDSMQYRSADEVEVCAKDHDPLDRLETFLKKHGWLAEDESAELNKQERRAVLQAMEKAERRPKPSLEHLFSDVYHEIPPHLQRQQHELSEHLLKYQEKYSK